MKGLWKMHSWWSGSSQRYSVRSLRNSAQKSVIMKMKALKTKQQRSLVCCSDSHHKAATMTPRAELLLSRDIIHTTSGLRHQKGNMP
jgi:hypothetical protein